MLHVASPLHQDMLVLQVNETAENMFPMDYRVSDALTIVQSKPYHVGRSRQIPDALSGVVSGCMAGSPGQGYHDSAKELSEEDLRFNTMFGEDRIREKEQVKECRNGGQP